MKRRKFNKRGLLAMRADLWGTLFGVPAPKAAFEMRGETAIVEIEGPLTHHKDWWCDSYDEIKSRVGQALESDAKNVVLKIDSPGGDVSGCFETSREIRTMAASKGKRLVAYADGMAASAGYALACAADEIYLSSTGIVGSIGVISTLMDWVEMDKKMGLNFAIVTSGERKKFGHPSVPISEGSITNAQNQVNTLAALFFALVSESRGMSVESIASLEAGVLIGKESVTAKLADDVCTFDELLENLSSAKPASSSAEKETTMTWKEALQKAADEGDEEAKKALAALEGDEEEEKAEGEDDKDKDDENKSSEDDKENDDKAAAVSSLSLAATVQSLAAWKAEKEEKEERETLMASRPDFAPAVVAFLNSQPIEVVRDAVNTFEKGKPKGQVAAARAAVGVIPKEATTSDRPNQLPPDEAHDLDVKMGLAEKPSAIRHEGTRLILGVMTPEQAKAELARRNKTAGGAR